MKLRLDDLSVKDIENMGSFMDKQDPGLIIKIGNDHTFTTDRIQDGGTDASFPETFDDIIIAYDDIKSGIEIEVEVHNKDNNNKSSECMLAVDDEVNEGVPRSEPGI